MSSKRKIRERTSLAEQRGSKKKSSKSKRKKISSQNLPALKSEERKRLRMTKRKVKELSKLSGEFKFDVPDIFNLLDENSNDVTNVQRQFLRSALASVIDIIPHMENQLKKSKREQDAYALNSMISQGRDILSDLRALSDSSELSLIISESVINPSFSALSHNFISLLADMRDEMLLLCKDDPTSKDKMRLSFQKMALSFGEVLDMSSTSMKDSIATEIS